jgi:hypothetical protein
MYNYIIISNLPHKIHAKSSYEQHLNQRYEVE